MLLVRHVKAQQVWLGGCGGGQSCNEPVRPQAAAPRQGHSLSGPGKPVKLRVIPKCRLGAASQAWTEGKGDILNFIRIQDSVEILITANKF